MCVVQVLFWQIGMLCFTAEEAKRLIGIVNMGAAAANLANGLTVALLIKYVPGGASPYCPRRCCC